ncbi:MAG: PIN domain-containing protein [Thaumarchaeota archaeon]|jgi:predicted nucleic acid-binding protein|nr:PIN domain-containing protein [Nitrososphaerota archaeon]
MKVLLDTTFMLPIVGVSVKGIASEVLNKLWQLRRSGEVELFYTEFNLLEILWVLSKLNYELPIVERGLKSIEKNMVKTQPKYSSLLKALELRKKGFHDVIDLLLYLTAKDNELLFLTYDAELKRFLEGVGEDVSIIIESV